MVSFVAGLAVVLGLAVPLIVFGGEAICASLLARDDRHPLRSRQLLELCASMEHMTIFVTNGAHLHLEVVGREAYVQFFRF